MADPPDIVPHSTQSVLLSPMAVSLLGLEQAGLIRAERAPRDTNMDRRVTSYYNHFRSRTTVCDDSPPSYATSSREGRIPVSPRHFDNGNEVLPKYTCSVFKEGPMHMLLEAMSPFLNIPLQEWRPVYVVLQGTALYIHKLKTTTIEKHQLHEPGKLLRVYTLQHAEVGLAPDVSHTTVTPLSRLASLLPFVARRRALDKGTSMFRVEKHFAMRVRSELDQFILTHCAEEQVMSWVNHIAAGIDVAPAIDERAAPRQCTMPRRRRRPARPLTLSEMNDEHFIDQQRRLLSMFSSTTEPAPDSPPVRPTLQTRNSSNPGAEQDQEEVDLSAIAEDVPTPTLELTRTVSQTGSPFHAASAVDNFTADGKWAPPHPRSPAQQWRYIRRCMPILLPDTPRHSSVMINDGRYVRPNFHTEALESWALAPPPYDAHDFPDVEDLVDSGSSSSRSADSLHEIQRVDSTAGAEEPAAAAHKAFALEDLARALRPQPRREASKLSTNSTVVEGMLIGC